MHASLCVQSQFITLKNLFPYFGRNDKHLDEPDKFHNTGVVAKNKTLYQCTSCGMEQAKWLGRCPGCGEWNTFEEVRQAPQSVQGGDGSRKVRRAETLSLDTIRVEHDSRITTGIREFDRILGGGLVRGSSVLLGGEPGIGKSTLLLQLAGSLSGSETVLYISGEESPEQIKRRADRIGVSGDKIILAHETDMDRAAPLFDSVNPTVIFIDSIQTMMSTEAGVVPGTGEPDKILFSGNHFMDQGTQRGCHLRRPRDKGRDYRRAESYRTHGGYRYVFRLRKR